MKLKFSIFTIVIIIPFLLWLTIGIIWYLLGLEFAFKTFFNFFLGIVYAVTSFYCAYYHNKSQEFEKRKDWFSKKLDYTNSAQTQLEENRRELLYTKLSRFNDKFQATNNALYILQGIIALAVSIEFLLGWA